MSTWVLLGRGWHLTTVAQNGQRKHWLSRVLLAADVGLVNARGVQLVAFWSHTTTGGTNYGQMKLICLYSAVLSLQVTQTTTQQTVTLK